MLRGNILSGTPFRTAILCLAIFIVIQLMMGVVLYKLTETSLYHGLEAQISEEIILFNEIYENGGQHALIDALSQLEQPAIVGERIAGLFDRQGNKLAGNMPIAPSFVGWQTLKLDIQKSGQKSHQKSPGSDHFHLFSAKLTTSTLSVGRSTRLIDTVLKQFLVDFALAGLVVVLSSLLIGYVLSRRVFFKLRRLADILNAVSRGDMQARLPVDSSKDQIDRVSQQINAHLDQLSMLMSSTRNTVNAIAHDLRAPLNRVYLLLQEAAASEGLDDESVQLIDSAATELTKVNEIVDTILRIARIEGGSDHQYFTDFSMVELVSDLADVFQPIIESAGQILIRDFSDSADVRVHGDRKMLQQMLVNLIENAICHCPAGTEITLTTGESPQRAAFVTIADTGPGIDPELRQKVLEPFFRLDDSRSSPGSGLGLTLVKAIVVRHGATLSLMDNGPGLRVRISFPPVHSGPA